MSDRATPPTIASEWGLACPDCGQDDNIEVELRVWATLSVDGTEIVDGDHEWDRRSWCRCSACDRYGMVREFSTDNQHQD